MGAPIPFNATVNQQINIFFFWSFTWVETGALETISLDIDNTYRM